MSNTLVFHPESFLGFQIIYSNADNVQYSLSVGSVGSTETEVYINTSCIEKGDKVVYGNMQFSLCTKLRKENGRMQRKRSVLPHSLVIRYSKELFSLFTIGQQFHSANHPIEIFKNDFNLLSHNKSGTLSQKHTQLVKSIIQLISSPRMEPEGLYESIQSLSQVIMDAENEAIAVHENNPSICSALIKIIDCVIENNFAYPSPKVIRRLTSLAKKTFEKEVRCYTPGTLKVFLSELQFKSGLYQIIYTKKRFLDIALEHGFSDQSAFTRSIKSKTGFSPRMLRNSSKQGLYKLLPKWDMQ